MRHKNRVWIAGLLISLIYWCTWHSYHDNPQAHFNTNPFVRHGLNFFLLLLVGIIGWWGWKSHPDKWIKKLWVPIYAAILSFMIGTGIIDLLIRFESMSFRNLLSGLRLFFTSPVPFGVLLFLSRFSNSGKNISDTPSHNH
jgi:ABC-type uncharacterized transport system YnjBCD permease subunit